MTPLHLWALGGAAFGAALPVLIHLLTRPRGLRRALPTFQFLSQSANFSTRLVSLPTTPIGVTKSPFGRSLAMRSNAVSSSLTVRMGSMVGRNPRSFADCSQ